LLYFVSAQLAIGYWLFALLSAIGALQWVAARYRLGGLALFDLGRHRSRGYRLAAVLVLGSTAAFFASQWDPIFAPGPAGSELAVLFSASALCALLVTLLGAPLLRSARRAAPRAELLSEAGPLVPVGHAQGRLLEPVVGEAVAPVGQPGPAVCLVPGGVDSELAMAVLARRLTEDGMVCLLIHPDPSAYAFPAALAILPAAASLLAKRPDVDPNRIAAVGDGAGGDLTIRSASTSKEVKTLVAVAPILREPPVGLGLLRELSYSEALRWSRDRGRAELVGGLEASSYSSRIPPRPGLLLYGSEDHLADKAARAELGGSLEVRTLPGLGHRNLAGHPDVMKIISDWLKEHL
jgi:acetyl esterase/lipase